jgi:cellulose synthase/poly-beta-1,6-N-acetylglucosamine synthase-like glycosyltransferase
VPLSDTAVIAIGRNEGARLVACLESVAGAASTVIYVDSGSTDDSVQNARRLGALVASLDMSAPFTAARARNAGLEQLRRIEPKPRFVMMVDGDCAIHAHWLSEAREYLESHPDAGGVCGRRREKYPQASIYNQLCDWEWNTRIGKTRACGGDVMWRMEAIDAIGGYDSTIIAGEDEEVCIRARKAGWVLWRLDLEMTSHDANIQRFGQWWKRMVRAGHSFAHLNSLYPGFYAHQFRRTLVWSVALPAIAIAGALLSAWPAAAVGAIYLLSFAKGARNTMLRGLNLADASKASALRLAAWFASLHGYCLYWIRRARSARHTIIEYK